MHADHLNRPLKMTDGTEAVVWDAVYGPFGEVVSITGAAANNLRFPGQYFLIGSGLHSNWYRHYEPIGQARYKIIIREPASRRAIGRDFSTL